MLPPTAEPPPLPSPPLPAFRTRRRATPRLRFALLSALLLGVVLATALHEIAGQRRLRACDIGGPTELVVVKKLAYEAFPAWVVNHPLEACPQTLAELLPYTTLRGLEDRWGTPYEHRCGDDLPPGLVGLWVRSAGPDRRFDTADDLTSEAVPPVTP